MKPLRTRRFWILLIGALALLPVGAHAQGRQGRRERLRREEGNAAASRYLGYINEELKRSYYDPKFHGVNIDSAYAAARNEIDRAASDRGGYRAIERFLERLDDSHTFFMAPWRLGLWDYHFGIRFVGDAAYVVSVDTGSSAENAALRRGDQIVSFAGQPLTRESYNRVVHEFLASELVQPLVLSVRAPDKSMSQITLTADTMEIHNMNGGAFRKLYSQSRDSSKLATSHVQAIVADSVFVWRLPQFTYADKGIKDVMNRAREHRVLIIDLRGNGGGSIETLTNLLGYFVDQPLVVGDLHMRWKSEKYVAKPKKDRFTGRTFILVDSETASAAEIFARLMQLQGKATVIGDRTAGAVLAANEFDYEDTVAASITVSDFTLYNGERLEKVGVKPDILALPPAQYIVAGTDPVLSLALLHAGARVSPDNAVRVLPVR